MTLAELLVALAVASIVSIAIYGTFNFFQRQTSCLEQKLGAQQNARAAVELMQKELLLTGYRVPSTAEPVEDDYTQNKITFRYMDPIDGTPLVITYELVGDVLKKERCTVAAVGTWAADSCTSTTGLQTVIENVEDFRLDYFNKSGVSVDSDVSLDESDIRFVRVSVTAQSEGICINTQRRASAKVVSEVRLRNLEVDSAAGDTDPPNPVTGVDSKEFKIAGVRDGGLCGQLVIRWDVPATVAEDFDHFKLYYYEGEGIRKSVLIETDDASLTKVGSDYYWYILNPGYDATGNWYIAPTLSYDDPDDEVVATHNYTVEVRAVDSSGNESSVELDPVDIADRSFVESVSDSLVLATSSSADSGWAFDSDSSDTAPNPTKPGVVTGFYGTDAVTEGGDLYTEADLIEGAVDLNWTAYDVTNNPDVQKLRIYRSDVAFATYPIDSSLMIAEVSSALTTYRDSDTTLVGCQSYHYAIAPVGCDSTLITDDPGDTDATRYTSVIYDNTYGDGEGSVDASIIADGDQDPLAGDLPSGVLSTDTAPYDGTGIGEGYVDPDGDGDPYPYPTLGVQAGWKRVYMTLTNPPLEGGAGSNFDPDFSHTFIAYRKHEATVDTCNDAYECVEGVPLPCCYPRNIDVAGVVEGGGTGLNDGRIMLDNYIVDGTVGTNDAPGKFTQPNTDEPIEWSFFFDSETEEVPDDPSLYNTCGDDDTVPCNYYFKAIAFDKCGNPSVTTNLSQPLSTICSDDGAYWGAPKIDGSLPQADALVVTVTGCDGSATASWTDLSGIIDMAGYAIYRGSSSNFDDANIISGTTNYAIKDDHENPRSLNLTSLTQSYTPIESYEGNTYYYHVKAMDCAYANDPLDGVINWGGNLSAAVTSNAFMPGRIDRDVKCADTVSPGAIVCGNSDDAENYPTESHREVLTGVVMDSSAGSGTGDSSAATDRTHNSVTLFLNNTSAGIMIITDVQTWWDNEAAYLTDITIGGGRSGVQAVSTTIDPVGAPPTVITSTEILPHTRTQVVDITDVSIAANKRHVPITFTFMDDLLTTDVDMRTTDPDNPEQMSFELTVTNVSSGTTSCISYLTLEESIQTPIIIPQGPFVTDVQHQGRISLALLEATAVPGSDLETPNTVDATISADPAPALVGINVAILASGQTENLAEAADVVPVTDMKLYYVTTDYTTVVAPTAGYTEIALKSDETDCASGNCTFTIPAEDGFRVWFYVLAMDKDGNFERAPEIASGAYVYDQKAFNACDFTPEAPTDFTIVEWLVAPGTDYMALQWYKSTTYTNGVDFYTDGDTMIYQVYRKDLINADTSFSGVLESALPDCSGETDGSDLNQPAGDTKSCSDYNLDINANDYQYYVKAENTCNESELVGVEKECTGTVRIVAIEPDSITLTDHDNDDLTPKQAEVTISVTDCPTAWNDISGETIAGVEVSLSSGFTGMTGITVTEVGDTGYYTKVITLIQGDTGGDPDKLQVSTNGETLTITDTDSGEIGTGETVFDACDNTPGATTLILTNDPENDFDPTGKKIGMSWSTPLNTDGSPFTDLADYEVYRNLNDTGFVHDADEVGPTYTDTINGQSDGATVYYYVVPVDNCTDGAGDPTPLFGADSNTVGPVIKGVCDAFGIGTLTLTYTINDGTGTITLDWTTPTGNYNSDLDGYRLFETIVETLPAPVTTNNTYTRAAGVNTYTTVDMSGYDPSTKFYYTVQAYQNACSTEITIDDTLAAPINNNNPCLYDPTAVTGLGYDSLTYTIDMAVDRDDDVNLTWTEPADPDGDIQGYRVYECTLATCDTGTPASWTQVNTDGDLPYGTSTTYNYSVTADGDGSTYQYYVETYDSCATPRIAITSALAKVTKGLCSVPSTLTLDTAVVDAGGAGTITLDWTDPGDFYMDGFVVYEEIEDGLGAVQESNTYRDYTDNKTVTWTSPARIAGSYGFDYTFNYTIKQYQSSCTELDPLLSLASNELSVGNDDSCLYDPNPATNVIYDAADLVYAVDQAVNNDDSIRVTWDAPTDPDEATHEYEILRQVNGFGGFALIAGGPYISPYDDDVSSFDDGTTFQYKVRTVDGCVPEDLGWADSSATPNTLTKGKCSIPSAPTLNSATFTLDGDGKVTTDWNALSVADSYYTGYRVYENAVKLDGADHSTATTNYVSLTAKAGDNDHAGTLTYTVRAYNNDCADIGDVESADSNPPIDVEKSCMYTPLTPSISYNYKDPNGGGPTSDVGDEAKLHLSWAEAATDNDISGYTLYQKIDAGAYNQVVGYIDVPDTDTGVPITNPGSGLDISTRADGELVEYQVEVIDSCPLTSVKSATTGQVTKGLCDTPVAVVLDGSQTFNGDGTIELTWTDPSDVNINRYEVWWRKDADAFAKFGPTAAAGDTSYLVPNRLHAATTDYSFYVVSVNTDCPGDTPKYSANSNTVVVDEFEACLYTPSQPTVAYDYKDPGGTGPTADNAGFVDLTGTPNAFDTDIVSYRLYESKDLAPLSELGAAFSPFPASDVSVNVSTYAKGTTLRYAVRAVDNCATPSPYMSGDSPLTSLITTDLCAVPDSSGVFTGSVASAVSLNGSGGVTVTWTSPVGYVDGFRVYECKSAVAATCDTADALDWDLKETIADGAATSTTTPITHTKVLLSIDDDTEFTYYVEAYHNDCDIELVSKSDKKTLLDPLGCLFAPDAIADLTSSFNGSSDIGLGWTGVGDPDIATYDTYECVYDLGGGVDCTDVADWGSIKSQGSGATTDAVTKVKSTKEFMYVVVAVDSCPSPNTVPSNATAIISGNAACLHTPDVPTITYDYFNPDGSTYPTAENAANKVVLAWAPDALDPDIASYTVYQSTDTGGGPDITTAYAGPLLTTAIDVSNVASYPDGTLINFYATATDSCATPGAYTSDNSLVTLDVTKGLCDAPASVTDLASGITDGAGEINLSWSQPAGYVDSYKVYRDLTGAGSPSVISSGAATTHTETYFKATYGSADYFEYSVEAINTGCSGTAEIASVINPADIVQVNNNEACLYTPGAVSPIQFSPTDFPGDGAVDNDDFVDITWTVPSDPDEATHTYTVERELNNDTTWVALTTADITSYNDNISAMPDATLVAYRVKTIDFCGALGTATSAEVGPIAKGKCDNPLAVTLDPAVIALGSNDIDLTWTPDASDAYITGYTVYVDKGSGYDAGTDVAGALHTVDTTGDTDDSITYSFKVVAYNDNCLISQPRLNSPDSNVETADRSCMFAPAKPTIKYDHTDPDGSGPISDEAATTTVDLSWTKDAGDEDVSDYNLYRYVDGVGPTFVATYGTTSVAGLSVSDVPDGETVYYTVTSVDDCAAAPIEGLESDVSDTITKGLCDAPTAVDMTNTPTYNGNGTIGLGWADPGDVNIDRFDIYQNMDAAGYALLGATADGSTFSYSVGNRVHAANTADANADYVYKVVSVNESCNITGPPLNEILTDSVDTVTVSDFEACLYTPGVPTIYYDYTNPDTTTYPTAENSADKIIIDWASHANDMDISTYTVYQSTDTDGAGGAAPVISTAYTGALLTASIDVSNGASYPDGTLINHYVKATDSCGTPYTSANSALAGPVVDLTKGLCDAPDTDGTFATSVSSAVVIKGSGEVTVTWTSPAGYVDGFNVYECKVGAAPCDKLDAGDWDTVATSLGAGVVSTTIPHGKIPGTTDDSREFTYYVEAYHNQCATSTLTSKSDIETLVDATGCLFDPEAGFTLSYSLNGSSNIALSWDPTGDLDIATYTTRECADAGIGCAWANAGAGAQADPATSDSVDGKAKNSTDYSYRIVAKDDCGNTSISNDVGPIDGQTACLHTPDKVTGLLYNYTDGGNPPTSDNGGSVSLKWNAITDTDIDHYNVYQSVNSGPFNLTNASLSASPDSFNIQADTVDGVFVGDTLEYQIAAEDSCGVGAGPYEGLNSAATTVITYGLCDAPGAFAVTSTIQTPPSLTQGSVKLDWTTPSGNLNGYRVYQDSGSGDDEIAGSPFAVGINTTTITYNKGAYSDATVFTYKVTAYQTSCPTEKTTDSSTDTENNNNACLYHPDVITGLTFSPQDDWGAVDNDNLIDLDWVAPTDTDLDGYVIYRWRYFAGGGSTGWVIANNETDEAITAYQDDVNADDDGDNYYYYVRAYDTCGLENPDVDASWIGAVHKGICSTPTAVTITDPPTFNGDGTVTLNWTDEGDYYIDGFTLEVAEDGVWGAPSVLGLVYTISPNLAHAAATYQFRVNAYQTSCSSGTLSSVSNIVTVLDSEACLYTPDPPTDVDLAWAAATNKMEITVTPAATDTDIATYHVSGGVVDGSSPTNTYTDVGLATTSYYSYQAYVKDTCVLSDSATKTTDNGCSVVPGAVDIDTVSSTFVLGPPEEIDRLVFDMTDTDVRRFIISNDGLGTMFYVYQISSTECKVYDKFLADKSGVHACSISGTTVTIIPTTGLGPPAFPALLMPGAVPVEWSIAAENICKKTGPAGVKWTPIP
jgi:type II secretory pathway pseudopilin PulG